MVTGRRPPGGLSLPLACPPYIPVHPGTPSETEIEEERVPRPMNCDFSLLTIFFSLFLFATKVFDDTNFFNIASQSSIFTCFLVTTSHSRCKQSGRIIDLTSAGLKIETAFPNGAAPTVC